MCIIAVVTLRILMIFKKSNITRRDRIKNENIRSMVGVKDFVNTLKVSGSDTCFACRRISLLPELITTQAREQTTGSTQDKMD